MKVWNRTQIHWDRVFATDVRDAGWREISAPRAYHHVREFTISAMPDGMGQVDIVFGSRLGSDPSRKDWEEIRTRLRTLSLQGINLVEEKDQHGFLMLTFRPRRGRQFTDMAIEVAREIGTVLGARLGNREGGLEWWLTRFRVWQDTLIRVKGRWIGFADYLRYKHKLQELHGTGWNDTDNRGNDDVK